MSTTTQATYSPDIFRAGNVEHAKAIILTEHAQSTAERWELETPHLVDLMAALELRESSLVLDYGCGIGRMSKALIEAFGCRVIGVDISADMRALSHHYVKDDRFCSMAPAMLDDLWQPDQFDAALSVWCLQHCRAPAEDITRVAMALGMNKPFFVVNEERRFVPCKEVMWIDDGQSVRELLLERFKLEAEGKLDPRIVTPALSSSSYWMRVRS